MSRNVRVNIFTRARRSLWKLGARRAPGWLWAGLDRTATWVHYHGPRHVMKRLFVTRARYEHDVTILVRTIVRLADALEAAGAGLEPQLRLIPGGQDASNPKRRFGFQDDPNRRGVRRFQDGAS
jgi:hypothetical protein